MVAWLAPLPDDGPTGLAYPWLMPTNRKRSAPLPDAELTTVSNAPSEDATRASGLSIGMVSKIENGQISPSLATIQAVAAALNVPFTALFAAFEEKRDCSYVPAGQGVVIDRRGTKAGHVYELLGALLGGDVVVEPYFINVST